MLFVERLRKQVNIYAQMLPLSSGSSRLVGQPAVIKFVNSKFVLSRHNLLTLVKQLAFKDQRNIKMVSAVRVRAISMRDSVFLLLIILKNP